jgi:hypothetical protein
MKADECDNRNIKTFCSSKGTTRRVKSNPRVFVTQTLSKGSFLKHAKNSSKSKRKMKANKKMDRRFEKTLQKEDIQVSTKHKKRLPTELVTGRKCKFKLG